MGGISSKFVPFGKAQNKIKPAKKNSAQFKFLAQPNVYNSTQGAFFIFVFFKKKIYRNIFLDLGFTVLYPYRPAGGR